MPVCIERDPDRAMAQMGGDLLDIKPFGDQETRARMPQIVRSDVADIGTMGRSRQGFADRSLRLGLAPMLAQPHPREDQIEVGPRLARLECRRRDRCPLLAQRIDDDG